MWSGIPTLPMSCRGGGLGDQLLAQRRQLFGETRHAAEVLHQQFDVGAGADQVVAGFVVALFRQRRQRLHGDVLDQLQFPSALADLRFEQLILVGQPHLRSAQGKVGAYPGQQDRRPDRLGDVIDGAEAEPDFLVLVGAHGRHEDHRNGAGVGIYRVSPVYYKFRMSGRSTAGNGIPVPSPWRFMPMASQGLGTGWPDAGLNRRGRPPQRARRAGTRRAGRPARQAGSRPGLR